MRSLVLAGMATLLFAAPALAGACPPKEVVFDPDASMIVCGDPRVIATLDNDGSNVDVTFRLRYISGNRADPDPLRKRLFTLEPGAERTLKPIWARGGSQFVIKAKDPQTGAWVKVLRQPVRGAVPWGTGDCPDGLHG